MSNTRQIKSLKREHVPNNLEPERENETHRALLNDVVLQSIFKYLAFNDLKSCREVGNITWLRNSKKAWWSKSKVVIKTTDKIEDYLSQTEIISNATNYKFEFYDGGLEPFWEGLGPSIKYLEFGFCAVKSADDFRKLLYNHCPNLEKIVFEFFTADPITATSVVEPLEWQPPQFGENKNLKFLKLLGSFQIPVSWMELLSHFPNLQGLETIVETDHIFKAISLIRRHDPKMLKLNRIKIRTLLGNNYDESCRSVLLDPKLSLEAVHIDAENCQPETVVDILDLHATSLEEVSIEGDETNQPVIKVPRKPLPNLEKLTIKDCAFPVEIFKFTPIVRKVHLGYVTTPTIHNILERGDPNLKVNSCNELTFYVDGESCDSCNPDFEFLLKAFPNVEILKTGGLNNFKFSIICERLPRLVTFNAGYESEVDVIGLLGYDPDSISNQGTRNPNISDLKELQSFSMNSKIYCETEEWKRIEMRNGSEILREVEGLRNLQKFQLKNYKFTEDKTWKKMFDTYSGQ